MRSERNSSIWRRASFAAAGFGMMALLARGAGAQEAIPLPDQMKALAQSIDTMWTLVAAFLVFWMQAGFAYVEGGFTRAKNQNNILMKNLLDFCFGTFAFWAVGFALMFGVDRSGLVGTTGWFLGAGADQAKTYPGIAWANVPLMAKFLFQLVFAATAATIVSGAMAERTKFSAYLIYSVAISAVIYPISGHWIWGGGWLATMGFYDFAGSTVVHSVGGWVALVGAIMLGPRIGKYRRDGKPQAIPGHNIPMAGLGVFILWLGWFGFNPGSTMSASGGAVNSIAHIAVTTNMAAAMGTIAALVTAWMLFGKPDVSMALNGALAGLVAVTAPCPWISPLSAGIIGISAGVIVVFAVLALDRIHVDDPVGAIPVHAVCGTFGTICVGLFSQGDAFGTAGPKPGLFFGGGVEQLVPQLIGAGAVFLWAGGMALVLFTAIRVFNGLRVSAAEEIEGLDLGEHGSEAYPDFGPSEGSMPVPEKDGHMPLPIRPNPIPEV